MSTLFQQPSCSGRDREPQDKTQWTAEMPPTSPMRCCQWSSIFLPTAIPCPRPPKKGSLRRCYSVPSSCSPNSTNYISTATLVSLSNSSTMKHDHKTDRISDLRGLITVIASASCLWISQLNTERSSPIVLTIECRAVNKISISGMLTLLDYTWKKQTKSRYALTAQSFNAHLKMREGKQKVFNSGRGSLGEAPNSKLIEGPSSNLRSRSQLEGYLLVVPMLREENWNPRCRLRRPFWQLRNQDRS